MTTEFVIVPTTGPSTETMELITRSGRRQGNGVRDLRDGRRHAGTGPRRVASRTAGGRPSDPMGRSARRARCSVAPHTDREEVARLISKYNLLAAPGRRRERQLLGIVTVDDVSTRRSRAHGRHAEVRRHGGPRRAVPEIEFCGMIRKRAGWLAALFLGEMLTATAMGHFEGEIETGGRAGAVRPADHQLAAATPGRRPRHLIIRAMALGELASRTGGGSRVRELPSGLALGAILGRGRHAAHLPVAGPGLVQLRPALPAGRADGRPALVGVVTFGSLAGSMLPFLLRRWASTRRARRRRSWRRWWT